MFLDHYAFREQIESERLWFAGNDGTTPAAIDNCLSVAERYDVQVAIHTDTLNESGFVEDTLAAFKGRSRPPISPPVSP